MMFFLFRHGETDWNRDSRFQGHADVPLNDQGLAQARDLEPLLRACRLDALISSDLSRAKVTAEIANAKLGLRLAFDADLREIDVGPFSGKTRNQIVSELGAEFWQRWTSVDASDLDLALPGGETKRHQLERGRAALLRAAETFGRQVHRVGVCTHGGMIRRLVHACVGTVPQSPIALPNACVYRIDHRADQWEFGGRVDDFVAAERSVFD